MSEKEVNDEQIKRLIQTNPEGYLTVGDLDKPFHRPECECEECEAWRKSKGRPTHAEVEKLIRLKKAYGG